MTSGVYTTTPDALLEEAAAVMRDHKVSALPVLTVRNWWGIITETNIFDAFHRSLRCKAKMAAALPLLPRIPPGSLSRLTKIIGDEGININRLAVYRGEGTECQVVITINSINTDALQQTLDEQGFKVLHISKNHA